MSNRAIKYRLYPTAKQSILFVNTFGCCRKVYNLMLADKIASYEKTKKFGTQTPAMYKKEYPFLREVDSLALANVQLNLQAAMKNCFDKTRKKQNGFPKFKSKKRCRKAYTTNNQNGTIAITDKKHIKLPKAGYVQASIHRMPGDDWTLKSATVSMEPDGKFYVSVLFELPSRPVTPAGTTAAIGLDYKSDGLYMDSNGHTSGSHKYYREGHAKLAKLQRRLSRKQGARKGETPSNNYLKQQKKVAKQHKHISNQRLDFLHKRSTEIANQYDVVCVETLNMRAMANKGFGNGKATLDNGYGIFLQLLDYKLAERGKYLVKVDKWYPSSQLCSHCGRRHPMKLSDRIYTCECGNVMDRDHNAAINILHEGLRILREDVA